MKIKGCFETLSGTSQFVKFAFLDFAFFRFKIIETVRFIKRNVWVIFCTKTTETIRTELKYKIYINILYNNALNKIKRLHFLRCYNKTQSLA